MYKTNQITPSTMSYNNEEVELLTRSEACQFLHVSQSMLDVHLNIPKVRIGRKVLYKKTSLLAFIQEAQTNE